METPYNYKHKIGLAEINKYIRVSIIHYYLLILRIINFPNPILSAKFYERCNLSDLDNTKKRQAFCNLEFTLNIKVINCQDFR